MNINMYIKGHARNVGLGNVFMVWLLHPSYRPVQTRAKKNTNLKIETIYNKQNSTF